MRSTAAGTTSQNGVGKLRRYFNPWPGRGGDASLATAVFVTSMP
jgi:hypothetical protein